MPNRIPATTSTPAHEPAVVAPTPALGGPDGHAARRETPAQATRHAAQLVHAARAADEMVRLVALSDEQDPDRASFIDALAAFDRWQRELRARLAR
jgi:hypothetical protein